MIWRRIRGVLGIGTIWGLPGAIVGALGGVVVSIFGGIGPGAPMIPMVPAIASGALWVGSVFFMIGSAFGITLALAERRRNLGELNTFRAGLWGAVGGAVAMVANLLPVLAMSGASILDPTLLTPILTGILAYAGLGGALGAATVAVAKNAPDALPASDPSRPELPASPR